MGTLGKNARKKLMRKKMEEEAATLAVAEVVLAPATAPALTCKAIHKQTFYTTCKAMDDGSARARQSRFKQDLTNLNKAVKKWLTQVEKGELLQSEMDERIRASPAAKHLREKGDFREDEFISQTIARATQRVL